MAAASSAVETLEKQKLVQEVWTEHIRKEIATLKVNTHFSANPRTIVVITDKPNHCTPKPVKDIVAAANQMMAEERQYEAEAAQRVANLKDDPEYRLRKMFHEADMLPTEKLDMPITTSHEIGWDATRYESSPRWSRPRNTTSLTQYVQSYIFSKGVSPFAKAAGPAAPPRP
ncbi:FAM183A and FAM183B related [Plasmodiophora brassicae]|nr:hypothetical protein PBRA_008901 [Plasmodiophora brassicae]